MDEAYDEIETPSEEITTADKILRMVDERESTLRILSDPNSYLAAPLEQAGTRQQAIDIVGEEIETLRSLDSNTLTPEQVSEISAPYRDRLDALPRS